MELAGPPAPEPVDLVAALSESTAILGGLLAEAGVSVNGHAAPDLPPARATRGAVVQVLVNLLDNAARHAPRASAVEVALERQVTRVRMRVRDRGPGLGNGGSRRLFDPFVREGPAGPGRAGLGIGLYVVRRWAEAFGGEVAAADHPEGGAEFVVSFPAWDEDVRP
jgi:signal transduction histidine kinase